MPVGGAGSPLPVGGSGVTVPVGGAGVTMPVADPGSAPVAGDPGRGASAVAARSVDLSRSCRVAGASAYACATRSATGYRASERPRRPPPPTRSGDGGLPRSMGSRPRHRPSSRGLAPHARVPGDGRTTRSRPAHRRSRPRCGRWRSRGDPVERGASHSSRPRSKLPSHPGGPARQRVADTGGPLRRRATCPDVCRNPDRDRPPPRSRAMSQAAPNHRRRAPSGSPTTAKSWPLTPRPIGASPRRAARAEAVHPGSRGRRLPSVDDADGDLPQRHLPGARPADAGLVRALRNRLVPHAPGGYGTMEVRRGDRPTSRRRHGRTHGVHVGLQE